MKRSKRIALLIDTDDFQKGYFAGREAPKAKELIKMYAGVTEHVFEALKAYDLPRGLKGAHLDHVGNYLAVPVYTMEELVASKLPEAAKTRFMAEQKEVRAYHRQLDALQGFIVKYVYPYVIISTKSDSEKKGGIDPQNKGVIDPQKKGVDAELICQALIGAMSNDYDIMCLLSDNAEYVPLVERIHDFFNKQVIQVGFEDDERGVSRLQAASYGWINLKRWT